MKHEQCIQLVKEYRIEAEIEEAKNVSIEERHYIKVTTVPANNWLYCVKCGVPLDILKNGVIVVATQHRQIANNDTYICPKCKTIIASSTKRWCY